ncbi:MAG: hypothetical protein MUE85_21125 [Microscillaceae bacterium]|jgi:hypothetical protein|nr:hypothetical protein [Microscillaceae bacterium]
MYWEMSASITNDITLAAGENKTMDVAMTKSDLQLDEIVGLNFFCRL